MKSRGTRLNRRLLRFRTNEKRIDWIRVNTPMWMSTDTGMRARAGVHSRVNGVSSFISIQRTSTPLSGLIHMSLICPENNILLESWLNIGYWSRSPVPTPLRAHPIGSARGVPIGIEFNTSTFERKLIIFLPTYTLHCRSHRHFSGQPTHTRWGP